MNPSFNVARNIEYIYSLFMKVSNYMQVTHEREELISFLDAEPVRFRSLAYESAAFEAGLIDLKAGLPLTNFNEIYESGGSSHLFHMQIGLGWSFAKAEISPETYHEHLTPLMQRMVYDGMGYYYGLFKGRRTIKSKLVPENVNSKNVHWFDEGLGRRLWYMSKGNVSELVRLIQSFPSARHPDFWRGVGIACGYVCGNDKPNLELLSTSSTIHLAQLRTGFALAAYSRVLSDSVFTDIELACEVICRLSVEDVYYMITQKKMQVESSETGIGNDWLIQLEKEFDIEQLKL